MTTRSSLLAASALACALLAGASASAQHGPLRGAEAIDFPAIDANGDGALSRDELLARATDRIAVIDLDADGRITRAELIEAFPARGGLRNVFGADPAEHRADRMLAMHGATAAGAVDVTVVATAMVNRLMTRMDANRDDALAPEEAEARRHADRGGEAGRRGPRF